jgi:hypothetical protein
MKVKVSFDGRNNNESWDVDEVRDVVTVPTLGELEISKAERKLQVSFKDVAEKLYFYKGIGLCRCNFRDTDGIWKPVFLTKYGRD